ELKFDKHFVDYSLDIKALIGVSDLNHIILRVEKGNSFENSYNFGKLHCFSFIEIRTGHGDEYRKPALIAIYSVKDAVDKLDDTLNEGGLILDNMRFIGSKNNERLLFYFYVHGYAERQFSIINPYTLTIKDAELLFREIECYKRLKICTILFDHIIKVEKDHLSIQNLAEHDAWSNYTKNDDAQMNLHTNIQDNEFDSLFKNKSFEELIDSFYGEENLIEDIKRLKSEN
ncbi:6099_t:CDS:2, partial [Gigaspora margarita]